MHNDEYCFGIELCVNWPDVPNLYMPSCHVFSRLMKVRAPGHVARTRCFIAQGPHCHIVEHISKSPIVPVKPISFNVKTICATVPLADVQRSAACVPTSEVFGRLESVISACDVETQTNEDVALQEIASNGSGTDEVSQDVSSADEQQKPSKMNILQRNAKVLILLVVTLLFTTWMSGSTNIGYFLLFATMLYTMHLPGRSAS